jgi:sugar-phosphatase
VGVIELPAPAALLVDFDGTLVDSEPANRAAWERFFAARGATWSDEVYAERIMGRRGEEVLARLPGPWSGEDPAALTDEVIAFLDVTSVHAAAVRGALDLLRRAHALSVPIAVVTSARRPWVDGGLRDVLGLADADAMLGVIVSAEDVTAGKPDPESYRLACTTLGAHPGEAVAFEDSAAGVTSARSAGVGVVIGVTTTTTETVLRGAGADHAVADLSSVRLV